MPEVRTEIDPRPYTVKLGDKVIAESCRTLIVYEGDLAPRRYFPPEDVNMALLKRVPGTTNCPWKGDWSFLNLTIGRQTLPNAAWTYVMTTDNVPELKDHVAFRFHKIKKLTLVEG